jgi:diaminopimelate epimerase
VDLATFISLMNITPFPRTHQCAVVHVVGPDHLRMRVWNDGVDWQLASGSIVLCCGRPAAARQILGHKSASTLTAAASTLIGRETASG